MRLTKVIIDNYRNFDYVEINFNNHSLVFGANDIGKTNLLKAIRLILDKSLSQTQYDADETDYCIYSAKNYIQISLEFTIYDEIEYENIISKYGHHIKEDKFYVVYFTSKQMNNIATFYIGYSNLIDEMTEIPRSFITSTINCIYLDSTRDLQSYLRRAKQRIISDYRNKRSDEEIQKDETQIALINKNIELLNKQVEQVSYISQPTKVITNDLKKMSFYNETINVKLTALTEFEDMTKNTGFISEMDGKSVEISGDGRKNQLYISMWARENIYGEKTTSYTIFILEEPEAHLHFPMQSTTLSYILNNIKNQMIISSHSPKVVLEFKPNSIIRLYKKNNKTYIADNGCSEIIEDKILEFGYRNNLISGDMFFSDGVFLVEGPSEEIFYNELCNQTDIDLNFFNIRVIPVNGVGFKPYVSILKRLDIPFCIRTDNDVTFRNNKKEYSGINRLIDVYNSFGLQTIYKFIFNENEEPNNLNDIILNVRETLEEHGLFLSDLDLENDLYDELSNIDFFNKEKQVSKEEFVTCLKQKKATRMFDFMNSDIDLKRLELSKFIYPIMYLINKLS